MQTKIIRVVALIFIGCLIIAGIGAAWFSVVGVRADAAWYAVYLDTGDLYFGHLSWFPSTTLSHAWYVQHSSQGDLSVNDFSKVSWKPAGTIQINRQHLVWTAQIASDSPLLSVMSDQTHSAGVPYIDGLKENIGLPLASPGEGTMAPAASSSAGGSH
ncbi:MAG: hypothetical protein WC246_01490 [Candidatus Paceibacterota bacterium]|jgi:hypothetical protein